MPDDSPTHDTMTAALREAIAETSLPYAAIERETSIKRQDLLKFAAGDLSLRTDKADRLAQLFGLTIRRPQWWLFPCETKRWRDFSATGRKLPTWPCDAGTQSGDFAFIYVRAPTSSITAWLRVESDAWLDTDEDAAHPVVCKVRIIDSFVQPLELRSLKAHADTQNLAIVRGGFRSKGGRPRRLAPRPVPVCGLAVLHQLPGH